MITEDYVSYNIAKLLKEKGFDIYCPTAYETMTSEHHVEETAFSDWGKLGQVKRPTLQMAMKWLREIHNYSISICLDSYVEPYDNEYYILIRRKKTDLKRLVLVNKFISKPMKKL